MLIILLVLGSMQSYAQGKNTSIISDTAYPIHKHLSQPNKAAIMSTILPGLGQIGHKDTWWHVPIIYTGFAVMGYSIYYNNAQYNAFRTAYKNSITADGGCNPDFLDNREFYRRNRDLSIIIASVWYLANILDAYTSAHLREFDINNNLAAKIEPLNISMLGNQPVVTCGLKLNLR